MAKSRATRTIECSHVSVTSLKAQSHDSATAATVGAECFPFPQSRVHQRKHNTNKSRQRPQQFCGAEFTHDTHKSRCKHNTNKVRQQPQRLCGIYPRTHKVSSRAAPAQTQHKQKPATAATIVRNLPTHPQVALHAAPSPQTKHNNTNKSRQRPQRLCGIYPRTPQSRAAAAPSPQTQHKQKPATAATIVRNLPTHPQSCAAPPPPPKHNTNKSRQRPQRLCGIYPRTHSRAAWSAQTQTQTKTTGNGRIDYAEFSHGGHQIPASKNVLKTSFSKGELGTREKCPLITKLGIASVGRQLNLTEIHLPCCGG